MKYCNSLPSSPANSQKGEKPMATATARAKLRKYMRNYIALQF